MHDRMVKAYILMNMLPQAAEAAERLAIEFANPTTILRAASIRAQMKEWKTAENIILYGLQRFPQNRGLLQARTELAPQSTAQLRPHTAESIPGFSFGPHRRASAGRVCNKSAAPSCPRDVSPASPSADMQRLLSDRRR
jgi:hypothetical protein